ncbi:hypothetical protein J3458_004856 [Metarhizium acridum]|uniref:uncharacterized protein n=1 Tax=Metarhizium acridum TaxID=92637 RepID=UPI001C6C93D2|nr:hypothetical protein J3458_004856 [Metarhizium acridum]
MSTKRISKEYAEISQSPPEGFTISLPPNESIHTWQITLVPPPASPFYPGKYGILFTLPVEYPFKPPAVRFTTRIYHPQRDQRLPGQHLPGHPQARELEALDQGRRRARRPAQPARRAPARRSARGEDRRRVPQRPARLGEERPPARRQVRPRGARLPPRHQVARARGPVNMRCCCEKRAQRGHQ